MEVAGSSPVARALDGGANGERPRWKRGGRQPSGFDSRAIRAVLAMRGCRRDGSGSELEGDYVSKMVDRIHALCPDSNIDVIE